MLTNFLHCSFIIWCASNAIQWARIVYAVYGLHFNLTWCNEFIMLKNWHKTNLLEIINFFFCQRAYISVHKRNVWFKLLIRRLQRPTWNDILFYTRLVPIIVSNLNLTIYPLIDFPILVSFMLVRFGEIIITTYRLSTVIDNSNSVGGRKTRKLSEFLYNPPLLFLLF